MKKIFKNLTAIILSGVILISFSQVQIFANEKITKTDIEKKVEFNLTKDEMLKDYDEMWNVIEKNYNYFGIVSRIYVSKGVDKEYYKVAQTMYREQIEAIEMTDTATFEFLQIISRCLQDMAGSIGHLGVIEPFVYEMMLETYTNISKEISSYKTWVNTLNMSKSKDFYKYMSEYITINYPEVVERFENTMNIENEEFENITYKDLKDEKILYITINSFADQFIEKDNKILMKLYEDYKDYKNIIIDISFNSGGNSQYWEKNIVAPNITEIKTSVNEILFRNSPLLKKYYPNEKLEKLSKEKLMKNENYKNIIEEDIEIFDKVSKSVNNVRPLANKKVFNGNFWLIIGEQTYSSSEMFADFCKQTGFATLVGQTTGGNGFGGEPVIFSLPNSGILLRMTLGYGLNSDGSPNIEKGTEPDFYLTPLDYTLSLIKQGK